jgi:hypothetical protein
LRQKAGVRTVKNDIKTTSIEDFQKSKYLEILKLGNVPHVEANTIMIEAGAVTIGVEYRFLTEDILTEVFGAEVAKKAMAGRYGGVELPSSSTPIDAGVSVHVFDAASGEERLRFDDLDQEGRHPAHYHYAGPDGRHALGWFDPVAEGHYMTWVFERLRTRLPDMLAFTGDDALAARVDVSAVARALPEVEVAVKAQALIATAS